MSDGVTELSWHPAAELFPMLADADLRELAEDIRAHGQKHPIVLLGGQILDGRNRYRACALASVEPRFEYVTEIEIGDPFEFVASLNLHRRHLNESQRAMVGARLREHYAAKARDRMLTGKRQDPRANLREGADGKASEQAAEKVNVSPRLVDSAARVREKGAPALIEAVERGDVKVSAAAEVARLPVDRQTAVVAAGPDAVVAEAREQREARRKDPEIVAAEIEAIIEASANVAALQAAHDKIVRASSSMPAELEAELRRLYRDKCDALAGGSPTERLRDHPRQLQIVAPTPPVAIDPRHLAALGAVERGNDDLETTRIVLEIASHAREFLVRVTGALSSAGPVRRAAALPRIEDIVLETMLALQDLLPADTERAAQARSAFGVINGGKQ